MTYWENTNKRNFKFWVLSLFVGLPVTLLLGPWALMGVFWGLREMLSVILEMSLPKPSFVIMFFLGLGGILGIIGGWTSLIKENQLKEAISRMSWMVALFILAGGISLVATMILLGPPFYAMGQFHTFLEYAFWLGFIGFGFMGMFIAACLVKPGSYGCRWKNLRQKV